MDGFLSDLVSELNKLEGNTVAPPQAQGGAISRPTPTPPVNTAQTERVKADILRDLVAALTKDEEALGNGSPLPATPSTSSSSSSPSPVVVAPVTKIVSSPPAANSAAPQQQQTAAAPQPPTTAAASSSSSSPAQQQTAAVPQPPSAAASPSSSSPTQQQQPLSKPLSKRLVAGDTHALPGKVLDGILDVTTMPLEDAIAHDPELAKLKSIASHIETAKKNVAAKFNNSSYPHGLTLDEAASIYAYTQDSPLYVEIGKRLRNPDRSKLKTMFPFLKLFFGGLAKLQPERATVFRAIKEDLHKEYPEGKKFYWWSVSSTTNKMGVLASPNFLGDNGTFFTIEAVDLVSIRDLSAIPGESEYLLLPGTHLEVVSVLHRGGTWMIQLKQIKSVQMVDAFPVNAHFTA